MCNETKQAPVNTVTRALTAEGYMSEPDPQNNAANAPDYLKVFCKGMPKNRRVDYLNLVCSGTGGEQVQVEGEETIYTIPAYLKTFVERVQYNLPCA